MSIAMLFKVISGTAICYAVDLIVIYGIFHFFVILRFFFFSLCMFPGGLLLEDLGHSQPPDEKLILIYFQCGL